MKRGLVLAVSGAAFLVAGLAGCSSDDKASSSSSSEKSSSSASASATSAAGGTKVTIDGQEKQIDGQVVCGTMGGNVNIAIGAATTGIAAIVKEDGSSVTSVGLGNVDGVTLAVGAGAGEAKAEKSGNTWKISGNATGLDMANPMTPVNKPFEIEVTCP